MTARMTRTRLAAASVSVLVCTATLSLATAAGASAKQDDKKAPITSVLTAVDDTLGGTVGVLPPVLSDVFGNATGSVLPRSGDNGGSKSKNKAKSKTTATGLLDSTSLLGDTTAALRNATAELPLLGPALSGTVDELGEVVPALKPSRATTAATPAKDKPRPSTAGPIQGVEAVRGPGVTWTMPMMTAPVTVAVTPVVTEVDSGTTGGGDANPVSEFVNNLLGILPSTAVGAAQLGVGAATVALIVLGGIAISGAAGAVSAVGRRDLAGVPAGAGTLGGILR